MTPEAIVAEARSWLGTPYHPHGRLRGVGVDCANLLCMVYETVGLVPPVEPGFYDTGWHLHRNEEMFLAWLERVGARELERPAVGCVGVWRFGRTYSHGGIVTSDDGLVVHSYIGQGVIESRLTEQPLLGRPAKFFGIS